ncbi:MAG: PilZ domain-containing protein [Proteobacteria bacterium]|nr:PilZ domain-containing protein [Pseudomonadota bacterium]
MDKHFDNRRDMRIRTQFETLYSAGRSEGAGVLADISYSGARLEGVSSKPDIGTELRLYVFLQPVMPFELIGEVVRHSENGFAIEYKNLDPEVRRLVDDAAALVSAPRV